MKKRDTTADGMRAKISATQTEIEYAVKSGNVALQSILLARREYQWRMLDHWRRHKTKPL